MDDMLNLCGLWARKDRNGVEYYVGKLTYTTKLMIFKNRNKETDKQPDFYITICKNSPQDAKNSPSIKTEEPLTKSFDDVPF